ncbi:MAG: hypothetical protein WBX38_21780 [Candidatus Sulfotelmatobacter sp.]
MAQEPELTDSPVGYAADIKPLFTQSQRDCMLQRRKWDLFDYETVKKKARAIYAAVADGSMPQDGPRWPDDQVALFKQWMDEGYQP